jgi:hypothetical protein
MKGTHMNSFKRRVVLILTAALVLTSIPFAEKTVSAEIIPETVADTEGISEASEPEYVEGDVIVCMSTGEDIYVITTDGGCTAVCHVF